MMILIFREKDLTNKHTVFRLREMDGVGRSMNVIQPCLFLRLVRSEFLEGREFLMIETLLVAGLSSGTP